MRPQERLHGQTRTQAVLCKQAEMQTILQSWIGHRLGLVIRYAAGCAPQFGKLASWALWLGGASSCISQVGGARDNVPQLGRITIQTSYFDRVTGSVQQSAKSVSLALSPSPLATQSQRLYFSVWHDCWLGSLPKHGLRIGSMAAQVL